MQNTPRQMKDYLRSYCFSLLGLCRKCNLKNIALTWFTLEENIKFDTSHNFTHFWTHYWQDSHFLKRLHTTARNVNLKSWQIAPSKMHHH